MSNFNYQKALKGAAVKTKSGKDVKVICETRGKLYCQVFSKVGHYLNTYVKYNYDGSRWSPNSPSDEDLVMA